MSLVQRTCDLAELGRSSSISELQLAGPLGRWALADLQTYQQMLQRNWIQQLLRSDGDRHVASASYDYYEYQLT